MKDNLSYFRISTSNAILHLMMRPHSSRKTHISLSLTISDPDPNPLNRKYDISSPFLNNFSASVDE